MYILTITESFLKLVRAVLPNGVTSTEVGKKVLNHGAFSYGPPLDPIKDNGSQFTSRIFQDVCKILNVHSLFKTISTYRLMVKWTISTGIYCTIFQRTSPNTLETDICTLKLFRTLRAASNRPLQPSTVRDRSIECFWISIGTGETIYRNITHLLQTKWKA